MSFLIGPALGALGSLLFKKKGGRIIKQVPSGQVFVQPKMNGGSVFGNFTSDIFKPLPAPIRRKKGGKVNRSKPKKQKK